ncbi:hypothetical protein [Cellulomonas gilvus]|uniref:Uncharacterized protein n=1 Tax=Cellulomonas gilvus (strain ATCC 13127 / NRRL B-14078) TaxID=593907 RepID=F8A2Y6_CELGA|nr:hypothetical protein [Cellulomonas gilvus]AEI11841.1 hypothetical protein Celgi_1322 [Cellulomonas gilvus ATCC 13127]
MSARYAAATDVSSDRSRAEIERTLTRYGADQFAYMASRERAVIAFVIEGRQVRFVLTLPDRHDREFTHHSRGARTASAAEAAYEQAVRQRWRALALVVKAKLEAVEAGIVTFEQEFLAHMVLPGGRSVFDVVAPAVEQAYATGDTSGLLQLTAGAP